MKWNKKCKQKVRIEWWSGSGRANSILNMICLLSQDPPSSTPPSWSATATTTAARCCRTPATAIAAEMAWNILVWSFSTTAATATARTDNAQAKDVNEQPINRLTFIRTLNKINSIGNSNLPTKEVLRGVINWINKRWKASDNNNSSRNSSWTFWFRLRAQRQQQQQQQVSPKRNNVDVKRAQRLQFGPAAAPPPPPTLKKLFGKKLLSLSLSLPDTHTHQDTHILYFSPSLSLSRSKQPCSSTIHQLARGTCGVHNNNSNNSPTTASSTFKK